MGRGKGFPPGATFCFLSSLFFLLSGVYWLFPFPSPHSEQSSWTSCQAFDSFHVLDSLPSWVHLAHLVVSITFSQHSFHFWFTPDHVLHLIRGSHGSLSSQSPLLTLLESIFTDICILIKPTWEGFLSAREEALGGSWTMAGVCVFGDDGRCDWEGPFITLCPTLYQRIFASKLNVCWGNESVLGINCSVLQLGSTNHFTHSYSPGCPILF